MAGPRWRHRSRGWPAPPWVVGVVIALAGFVATLWTFAVVPNLAWRTVVSTLPLVAFDLYAVFACLTAPTQRSKSSLLVLGVLTMFIAASSVVKLGYFYATGSQDLFQPAWQAGQFYLTSVVAVLGGAILFTLMAAQSLQQRLDDELEDRKRINDELRAALQQAERFRMALDKVPAHVYMKDRDGRYTYANQPTLELFGCTASELAGGGDQRFFPPEVVERLRVIDAQVLAGQNTREEVEVPLVGGGRRVYLEVKSPIHADDAGHAVVGICGISSDITAIKEHERNLDLEAHYDALTKLPNRVLLSDRLNQALYQSRRQGTVVVVVFLDIDGFKAVNDSHGHDVGDALLVSLSGRMQAVLRQGDTLSRLGGDEFVAVIVGIDKVADCEPVLQRLLRAAAEPVRIGALTVQVSASMGVTVYPDDDSDPDILLRHADQAMYAAKKDGRNCYRRFVPSADGGEIIA